MVFSSRSSLGRMDEVSFLSRRCPPFVDTTNNDFFRLRPQLEAISNRFNDTPVIGLVSTLIGDYMPLVDECTPLKLLVVTSPTDLVVWRRLDYFCLFLRSLYHALIFFG